MRKDNSGLLAEKGGRWKVKTPLLTLKTPPAGFPGALGYLPPPPPPSQRECAMTVTPQVAEETT